MNESQMVLFVALIRCATQFISYKNSAKKHLLTMRKVVSIHCSVLRPYWVSGLICSVLCPFWVSGFICSFATTRPYVYWLNVAGTCTRTEGTRYVYYVGGPYIPYLPRPTYYHTSTTNASTSHLCLMNNVN